MIICNGHVQDDHCIRGKERKVTIKNRRIKSKMSKRTVGDDAEGIAYHRSTEETTRSDEHGSMARETRDMALSTREVSISSIRIHAQ